MSRIFHVLWFAMIICWSSCAISKKENERIEKMISDEAIPPVADVSISSDSLSLEHLQNFELRAIQKLTDFYDYLNILGDDNFEKSIKNEVKASAKGLFADPETPIRPFMDDAEVTAHTTVEKCLDLKPMGSKHFLKIVNIEIIQHLDLVKEDLFVGRMSFQLSREADEDGIFTSKHADFSLRKIDKAFGDDSMKIWEVSLARIY